MWGPDVWLTIASCWAIVLFIVAFTKRHKDEIGHAVSSFGQTIQWQFRKGVVWGFVPYSEVYFGTELQVTFYGLYTFKRSLVYLDAHYEEWRRNGSSGA